jgi:hypothetical protein
VDVSGDDRAVETQLAATRDVMLAGQVDDVVEELLQGEGLDQIGPADQRGVIRHARDVDATELTQDKTIR